MFQMKVCTALVFRPSFLVTALSRYRRESVVDVSGLTNCSTPCWVKSYSMPAAVDGSAGSEPSKVKV